MPRLIVPSRGGGRNLIRTLRAGDAAGVGETVGDGNAIGVEDVDGVGDSCALATHSDIEAAINAAGSLFFISSESVALSGGEQVEASPPVPTQEKRNQESILDSITLCFISLGITNDSDVIAPVHVREKIVPPFAVAKKLFVDIIRHKQIVQSVETNKMIRRSFGRIFLRCPRLY